MSFGPLVPWHFVSLLQRQQLRALAMLAQYLAATKVFDHFWWFHGIADREVKAIQKLLLFG